MENDYKLYFTQKELSNSDSFNFCEYILTKEYPCQDCKKADYTSYLWCVCKTDNVTSDKLKRIIALHTKNIL